MKKLALIILFCITLTGCGSEVDTELIKLESEINTFCDRVVQIDTAINQITNITLDEAGLETATSELMHNLDMLKDEFVKLSNIDFPEEYTYLETLADEASDYMTEAVKSYHTVYEENYNESMEAYAQENYSRAYKRVKLILNALQGDDSTAQ